MGEIKRYTRRMWGDLELDPDGELAIYDECAAELARLRAVVAEAHEQWGRERESRLRPYRPCDCIDCTAHRASAQEKPQ